MLRKSIMINSHAYVRISITLLWTDTCKFVLVGMAHAFGRSSMCNKSESKVSLYGKEFEDLLVWSFLKMAMCFLCFVSRCSSLSSSPWTSRGGNCIFVASLYLLPFSRQSPSSFFLTLVTIAELPLSPERLCMLTIFYCTSLFRHLIQLLQQDVEALGKWK